MLPKLKVTLLVRVSLLLLLCFVISATNMLINTNSKEKSSSSSSALIHHEPRRHLMSLTDDHESNFSGTVINESLPEEDGTLRINSILNFTQHEQLGKNGRLVVHVMLSCYCFWMLAIICDEYFIASIHIFCQKLKIKHELASATFMTMATSSPELCISCVSTFISDGDVSLGTIVGSAIFNILAVTACCGLYARSAPKLNAWLLSRDCMLYALSIIGLIAVIYDHLIMWYEALLMVLSYGIYLIIMFKNDAMVKKMRLVVQKIKAQFGSVSYDALDDDGGEVTEITSLLARANDDDNTKEVKLSIQHIHPWRISAPRELLRWPITFLLWCTIPDCRRFQKFYILTFINCVAWILTLSYVIASMIAIVDSIVGFLFLGAGTSIPEAVSSVIVTMQGNADIGISNAIASNIFDILFCLGVSWTARTLIAPLVSGRPWIPLSSTGITFSAISLLATLSIFYFLFAIQRFKLNRKISVSCLTVYLVFIALTILLELNLFFPRMDFLTLI